MEEFFPPNPDPSSAQQRMNEALLLVTLPTEGAKNKRP